MLIYLNPLSIMYDAFISNPFHYFEQILTSILFTFIYKFR